MMESEDSNDANLKRIWRQQEIPVVFKQRHSLPILVRVPFSTGNKDWLRDGRRNIPAWNSKFKAWEIPKAWFDSAIKLCLSRYAQTYVIQFYREQQKCAPACWNAEGFHCECSCMGENHGAGHPGHSWYEVSDTFAFSWGTHRYSCRHLLAKGC